MEGYRFIDDDGSFALDRAENVSGLYLPLAGERGLKSAVTPTLAGDAKLDQNGFLLEPASIDDLANRRPARSFWARLSDGRCFSLTGASAQAEAVKFTDEQDESGVEAGLMWQRTTRSAQAMPLGAEITSFVPPAGACEVHRVEIVNTGEATVSLQFYAAIPIYGRSAANIRDHRHVTSLLHRIRTTGNAVLVRPTLSFDERGHVVNDRTWFVLGAAADGAPPEVFFPTEEGFLGEGGSWLRPRAVFEALPGEPAGVDAAGCEAAGAMRFSEITLGRGERAVYIILDGAVTAEDGADQAMIEALADQLGTAERACAAFEETRAHWRDQVNVRFRTGDGRFDRLMIWVAFQPFLRRIYGCSFLPHHDYGKGGRGWRDLWQDCLALLLMNPGGVRKTLLNNFRGVRMDGSNATIIGENPGEFLADRNGITRLWMDHGFWPFLTTKLYLDQTGDLRFLDEEISYFKDGQICRATQDDDAWDASQGTKQRDANGGIYRGSVWEHLLLQNLCAVLDVGEHGELKLRGADWNDALDMAEHRGESVAFTCAYAGNLAELASLARTYEAQTGRHTIPIAEELARLIGAVEREGEIDVTRTRAILADYTASCAHTVSGRRIEMPMERIAATLHEHATRMMTRVRRYERVTDGEGRAWINSYYDDNGRQTEGVQADGTVRMMLTGQVFAIMSGMAQDMDVRRIVESADRYLYAKERGGYILNTDFHEVKTDLGRMFGFAYGEKENGAVFSHMTVMYAYALYRRGFAAEGHRALRTLADAALNFPVSRIYPGIPEYFDGAGRGKYAYLTGAASWYLLTLLAQVFGARGELGDLRVRPQLMPEQFGADHTAGAIFPFAGREVELVLRNPEGRAPDISRVVEAALNGCAVAPADDGSLLIPRAEITGAPAGLIRIEATLG